MEVSFNIDLDPAKLVGRRLILCCYWHPKLKMFEVPNENCAFLRIGDHWVDMRRVVGFPPERRVAVTTAEVNALIQETTLPALTGKADLIVIGQVRAVVDSSIAAPGQQQYRVQKVVLKVQRVLKGPPRAHAAWFLVARGHELPSWDTVTPRSLGVGETWMVFLRRDGDIFYPLGGVNGLLLLEGQKVFFDRTVRVPISRSMLTWKISQAVNK